MQKGPVFFKNDSSPFSFLEVVQKSLEKRIAMMPFNYPGA